jgi:hypothetical protein
MRVGHRNEGRRQIVVAKEIQMLPIWVLTVALVALVIWAGSKHEDSE